MNTNYGHEAYKQGESDADYIYSLHGIKTIREIARYKTLGKNDYVKGKIERARQILNAKEKNHVL